MLFKIDKVAYTESEIASKGRQDGTNSIPAIDDENPAPYEIELMEANRQMASKVSESCREHLEKIDGKLDGWKVYPSENYQNELQFIEENYRAEIEHCNNNPILKHAVKNFESVDRIFQNKLSQLNRMPLSYLPLWVYLFFATLIGIGEIPLNALVFNIFGENQIMTWVMSAIIGLCIPLTAHFIGIKVREHGDGFSFPNAIKAAIVFIIIIAALFALAIMRQEYLGLVKEDIGLDDRIVDISFMFFWLNIAVFVTAILISYLSHDPVPGYEKAYRDSVKAKSVLEKEQSKQTKGIKAADDRKAKRERAAKQQKTDAEKMIRKLEGEFDACLMAGQEQEDRWLHQLGRDVACYRRENLVARRKEDQTKKPLSFEHSHSFKLKLPMIAVKTTMSLNQNGVENKS